MENLAALCVGHSPNFLLFIRRGIPNVLPFVWARFLTLSLFGAFYLLIISSPSVCSIGYLRFYLRLLFALHSRDCAAITSFYWNVEIELLVIMER